MNFVMPRPKAVRRGRFVVVDVERYEEEATKNALDGIKSDIKEYKICNAAVRSDAGLQKWAEANHVRDPFVRLNVYGEWSPPGYCEFEGFCFQERRRPVVMRGSKVAVLNTYRNGGEWIVKVIKRWARIYKITDIECEYDGAIWKAQEKLQKKFNRWDARGFNFKDMGLRGSRYDTREVFLRGKLIEVRRHLVREWIKARENREKRQRLSVPKRISPQVARRALRELGVYVPLSAAQQTINELLTGKERSHAAD